jgi:hypothetical protein
MLPLRIVETDREGFEEPVVELWRDDEFVGMVFWDGEAAVVQVYPAAEGDVHDLELRDLLRVLDMAERIVDPFAMDDDDGLGELRLAVAETEGGWDEEDPATVELVEEFDPQALHRSDDGEGYFPGSIAPSFITRCEELGLAVVEMEGFDWDGRALAARPGLELMVRPETAMSWGEFRSYANARAADTLNDWPTRDTLVIAFVVQQPDGETFVA